jgi:hypothetical protein
VTTDTTYDDIIAAIQSVFGNEKIGVMMLYAYPDTENNKTYLGAVLNRCYSSKPMYGEAVNCVFATELASDSVEAIKKVNVNDILTLGIKSLGSVGEGYYNTLYGSGIDPNYMYTYGYLTLDERLDKLNQVIEKWVGNENVLYWQLRVPCAHNNRIDGDFIFEANALIEKDGKISYLLGTLDLPSEFFTPANSGDVNADIDVAFDRIANSEWFYADSDFYIHYFSPNDYWTDMGNIAADFYAQKIK